MFQVNVFCGMPVTMFTLSFNQLQAHQWGGMPMAKPMRFQVCPKAIIHLSGANGSGKSTLMRMILGLSAMGEGSIEWDHPDGSSSYTSHSAYMGHELGLHPLMTVKESLQRFTHLYPDLALNAAQSQAWIDAMGLRPLLDYPTQSLSAGQCQALAWCQLLMLNRLLWWLDEPFAHLDEAMVATTTALIQQHCAQGGAVVYTTHAAIQGLEPTQTLTMEALP